MIATWKQYEGQAVDGIPLLRLLGGSEASAVYLGELGGSPCAIKLVPAEEATAQIPLARWQQASKLSHPHLATIHQWGRARLNGASLVYLAMEYRRRGAGLRGSSAHPQGNSRDADPGGERPGLSPLAKIRPRPHPPVQHSQRE